MTIKTKVHIFPSKAKGIVTAPPSKSISHRLLISAALTDNKSLIHNIDLSQDLLATLECLKVLGSKYEIKKDDLPIDSTHFFSKKTISISGFNPKNIDPNLTLDCKESASTLRFLIPLVLLSKEKIVFRASENLLKRPLNVYEKICNENNLFFKKTKNTLTVEGPIGNNLYTIPGNISSQFVSGLLFALPLLEKTSQLVVTAPIESRPYIDMTLQVLSDFGIVIQKNLSETNSSDNLIFTIPGKQVYKSTEQIVEGDYSNAAFFEAFNFIGGEVEVRGLNPLSKQGDKVYWDLFMKLSSSSTLPLISLADYPDLGPILFALAAALNGGLFKDTRRLANKESNRLLAMKEELKKFGVGVNMQKNSVYIKAKKLIRPNSILDGHNDHRIIMALSVLASITGGTIKGTEAVNKSFPDFFQQLKLLGIEFIIDKA